MYVHYTYIEYIRLCTPYGYIHLLISRILQIFSKGEEMTTMSIASVIIILQKPRRDYTFNYMI